jgi:transcription elongation factor Elf1
MRDKFECPHCGSVYSVEWHKSIMRDDDHADCDVCHRRMDSWNSSRWPFYRLIEAKEPPVEK